jgi:carbonic anhydrase
MVLQIILYFMEKKGKRVMKKLLAVGFMAVMLCFGTNIMASANHVEGICAEDALQKLKDGNSHFVKMQLTHPNVSKERLAELEEGQNPFVAILSCSDSRVPPEIIFDQGLGDLFVVRNAGNVPGDQAIGSIEYAVAHAGVKLVVVLGHEKCGAVKAAGGEENGGKYIESLTSFIKPSVVKAKTQSGCLFDNAAKNNAIATAKALVDADPVIAEYVKHHGVKVIPAYYSLHTGKVEFLK